MVKKFNVVEPAAEEQTIAKPAGKFSLNKFKSTRDATVDGVNIALGVLPIHSLADAKDFVRLHPTEWTCELCFCMVPIKGAPRESLHLIEEEVATQCLHHKKIIRQRLALASKPLDKFFLCIIPSTNLDNTWVSSNLQACEQAKTLWTQALSQRDEGKEGYAIVTAASSEAFPEPKWPAQSLEELIETSFAGGDRMITHMDHPALDRLLGRKSKAT